MYSGHNMIAEYGSILKESRRFQNSYIETEIDLQRLEADRRRMTTFVTEGADKNYERVYFRLKKNEQNSAVILSVHRSFLLIRLTEKSVVTRFLPFRQWV